MPQCPEDPEDPGDHPSARGRPTHVQGQGTMVHMRGAVQERWYKVQITVTQRGQESMELIARYILETGGEENIGQAPRGPAARHLVQLLKDMGQRDERM